MPPPGLADVRVVIPTRDRPELLRRAASSVRSQVDVVVDLVIADDGSRDGRAVDLVARDVGATVVREDRPWGVAAARNAGAQGASSTWIGFLDDDDFWAPTKLARQLTAAGGRAGFVVSGVVHLDSRAQPVSIDRPRGGDLARQILLTNIIPAGASNVLLRKDLFVSVGGFDESLATFADWDLWIRTLQQVPAAVDPGVTVAYVHHAGARLSTFQTKALEQEIALLRSKHAALHAAVGLTFDEPDVWRWWREQRRARGRMRARSWIRGQPWAPARLRAAPLEGELAWLQAG